MKIVIMTVGSYGDVLPYVGLGLRLRQAGHDVALATEKDYAALIRAEGLEYRRLPGNSRADMDSEEGRRWQKSGTAVSALFPAVQMFVRLYKELCTAVPKAAEGADLLLLHTPVVYHGYAVAKAMGIPSAAVPLFPTGLSRTGEFSPPEFGLPNLGRWANRNVDRLIGALTNPLVSFFKDFQAELGLPRVGIEAMVRRMHAEEWPILHALSPEVLPRPRDWRPGIDITGYLWPPVQDNWRPSTELTDFLAAGPPPVFVGFGSMAQSDGERLTELVADALRHAGVRGIVGAGWAGLSVQDDTVRTVGNVPHEWLFPRMAAVVHHGGAGTTGAGVRAGVPSVVVPMLGDQPFWARRLVSLGVSPGFQNQRTVRADRLGELIREAVTDPGYRQRAERLADRVNAEDGAGNLIKAVEHMV